MAITKPKVVAWLHSVRQESDVITDKVRHVWGTPLGSMAQYTVPLIRLSDYEALQAERDTLLKQLKRFSKWAYPSDEGCKCDTCREAIALTEAINNIVGRDES